MSKSTSTSLSAKRWFSAAAFSLVSLPVVGAPLALKVTLPEIASASYYRPYMAAWIEDENRQSIGTLAVWYDTRIRDDLGKGWLRELKTWWRTQGKNMSLPADGISGATQGPGEHTVEFAANHPTLNNLKPGNYQVVIEVAREQGGRDLVRIPFVWGGADMRAGADGKNEIQHVSVLTAAP